MTHGMGSPHSAGISMRSRLMRFLPHSRIASSSNAQTPGVMIVSSLRWVKESRVRLVIRFKSLIEDGDKAVSNMVSRSSMYAGIVPVRTKSWPCHSQSSGSDLSRVTKREPSGPKFSLNGPNCSHAVHESAFRVGAMNAGLRYKRLANDLNRNLSRFGSKAITSCAYSDGGAGRPELSGSKHFSLGLKASHSSKDLTQGPRSGEYRAMVL